MRTASKSLYLIIPFIMFGMFAGVSVVYVVFRTISASGATDFHSYWYAGHFIRQGLDPYTAFINNISPRVPVAYIDGPVVTELPVAQPGLARVPANTPLMVELLSVFSLLSWPTAKVVWMVCNLTFIFVIPFLTLRMLPNLQSLPLISKLFFVLVFLSLFGTRNTVGNGQTSALVFAMMLLAILTEEPWLGGIALGIALSKYSLSLPALILLALEKKYFHIFFGGVLQVLGFLLLVTMTGEPLESILKAYFTIAQSHLHLQGVHLPAVFPQIGWLIALALSIGVAAAIGWYSNRVKQPPYLILKTHPLTRPIMFNILMLWALMVIYHRAYDTLVTITFIALMAEWLLMPNVCSRTRSIMIVAVTVILLVLMLPARGVEIAWLAIPLLSTEAWLRWHSIGVALSLLIALLISIWILFSTKRSDQ